MEQEDQHSTLAEAREEFVSQWGTIGSSWGINRTMAQIHALLMTSPHALSTDEVMAELQISRGNANTNLRDLIGWGLIRSVIKKGERKEYFEAEKDVWKIACTVARERKRREITPAMEVLKKCAEKTKGLKSTEARAFHGQISSIQDFLKIAERVLDTATAAEQSRVMKMAARLFTL